MWKDIPLHPSLLPTPTTPGPCCGSVANLSDMVSEFVSIIPVILEYSSFCISFQVLSHPIRASFSSELPRVWSQRGDSSLQGPSCPLCLCLLQQDRESCHRGGPPDLNPSLCPVLHSLCSTHSTRLRTKPLAPVLSQSSEVECVVFSGHTGDSSRPLVP